MNFDNVATSGILMQSINILSNDGYLMRQFQLCQSAVRRVWLRRCDRRQHGQKEISKPPRLKERRLEQPFPVGELLGRKLLPESTFIPKSRDAALC